MTIVMQSLSFGSFQSRGKEGRKRVDEKQREMTLPLSLIPDDIMELSAGEPLVVFRLQVDKTRSSD